ncbi:MAG: hypothetical protein ACE5EM_12210, partial [Sphingomonadales bacterium]
MRLFKQISEAGKIFAVLAGIVILVSPANKAQAELPAVKIGTASLQTPSAADSFYGAATLRTDDLGRGRPAEIKELARALRHDADLIYQFVRNRVEITAIYGLQKGALGALTDKHGTAFDQAHLMVELLREADAVGGTTYNPTYKAGTITLNQTQFSDWFGISNAKAACQFLADGGIPATVNGSTNCSTLAGNVSSVVMGHIWVQATVGGQTLLFDPAYKTHIFKAGIDLATAMGYTPTGFLGSASTGMIQSTANGVAYVKDVNNAGVVSTLDTYATNLLTDLKTNHPDDVIEDIVGGGEITDVTIPAGGAGVTSLPYTASVQHSWTGASGIPDQYRTRFTVTFDDTRPMSGAVSHAFFVDEIYGRRMELVPDSTVNHFKSENSALPAGTQFNVKLQVDGLTVVTHTSGLIAPSRGGYFVDLVVNHPYAANAGAYMDETVEKRIDIVTNATIVHGWGHVSGNLMSQFGEELGKDTELGYVVPFGSEPEPVQIGNLQEGVKIKLGANWLAQFSRMTALQAEIGSGMTQHHHSLGTVFAQTFVMWSCQSSPNECVFWVGDQGMRIDVEIGLSVNSETANATDRAALIHGVAASASALEGSIMEQMLDAVDTASTAERFVWAEAESSTSESGVTIDPRYYLFTPADIGKVEALILAEGLACDAPTRPEYLSFACKTHGAIEGYLNEGYNVLAVNDSFLGPGYHLGFQSSSPGQGGSGREPTIQRGGAFFAYKPDGSQIAHIVDHWNSEFKGGGAALSNDNQDEVDPAKSAEILKDRFEDRSVLHGVDLATGRPSFSIPEIRSVGAGSFPYKLSSTPTFRNGFIDEDGDPEATSGGWKDSNEAFAAISGGGMEGLGASSHLNAAGSIVAFFVAQDLYKQSAALDHLVLLPFVNHWWLGHMSHNVVTLTEGHSATQFVRLADGSFNAPQGRTASLQQTGAPAAVRSAQCSLKPLNRQWDYSGVSWSITLEDGSVQNYGYKTWLDPIDQCIRKRRFVRDNWIFPFGITVTYSYDAEARLTRHDNGFVSLGASGSITTPAGDVWSVTSGSLPAGSRPRPQQALLGSVFDPHSATLASLEYAYDRTGRVKTVKDAQAIADEAAAAPSPRGAYSFYIAEGFRGERVDPMGGAFTVFYDNKGRADAFLDELGRTVTAEYDNHGRVIRRVFPEGDQSLFEYDARHNVTKFTAVAKPGSGLANRVAQGAYHATFNKPLWVRDFNGNTTNFTFDATTGLLVTATQPQVTDGLTGLPANPTWTFTYNARGQLLTRTDPTGLETTNAYYTSADGEGDLDGFLKTATADSAMGGFGFTTYFGYNSAGDVTSFTDPRGTAPVFVPAKPAECLSWEPELNTCILWSDPEPARWDFDPNYTTTMAYDADRRETRVTDPLGNYTQNIYSGGRLTAAERYDAANVLLQTTSMTYTATGKELAITSPDGAVTTNAYDDLDRLLTVTDPVGRVTRNIYDAGGQQLKEIRAFGSPLQQDYATYAYSVNGQQTSVTDANGNLTEYFYDGFDRLIKTQFPSKTTAGVSNAADTETFTYDAGGNVLTKKTRNGDVITSVYDALNRVTSKTPGLDKAVNYQYDRAGRQTDVRYADASYIMASAYDGAGRLASVNDNARAVSYQYDAASNRTEVMWPDGFTANYFYDALNRVTAITENGTDPMVAALASYNYDALSRR